MEEHDEKKPFVCGPRHYVCVNCENKFTIVQAETKLNRKCSACGCKLISGPDKTFAPSWYKELHEAKKRGEVDMH